MSEAGAHTPEPVVWNTSFTECAVVSAAEGAKVALREFGLVITPVTPIGVDHTPPVALVTTPSKVTVLASIQIFCVPPALAVGAGTKPISTLLKTEGHVPAMVDRERVTPELLSEAEG